VGQIAEAIAASVLVDQLGFNLVWQITAAGGTGVDLIVLTPGEASLVAIEVKGTLRAGHTPRLSRARGGQMSRKWLEAGANPGMADWGLEPGDLYSAVMVIDLAEGTWRAAISHDLETWAPVKSEAKLAWPKPALDDGRTDYEALASAVRAAPGSTTVLAEAVSDAWSSQYRSETHGPTELVEVTLGALTYLFDIAQQRLVGAYGTSKPTTAPRPQSRIRGHPSPNRPGEAQLDRGHVIAHTLGGGADINLVPQLHTLNIGNQWRAYERYAQQHPGTFLMVQLEYTDPGQRPAAFTYGIVRDGRLDYGTFSNESVPSP
jgi:hypothetical protein